MKVIKEAWLLKDDESGMFKCMQNTNTPKLYVSETSAKREVKYQANNSLGKYTAVKAFLVVESEPDQLELPF
jgi:hypothetical protein